MKTWLQSLWKKKEEPAPSVTPAKREGEVVMQFPKEEYNAYWEMIPTFNGKKWEVKVRYYKYLGGLIDESTLVSVNKDEAIKAAQRNIVQKMQRYKK